MKEKKEKKQQDRQDRKFKNLLPKLPKELKIFLSLLAVVVLSALVLFFGHHVSYKYWLHEMGNGAHEYSDETYKLIEEAISKCMIQEAGPDIVALQNFLDNPETIGDTESTDTSETVGDSEAAGKSETIGRYFSAYENGQTKLVCSIQDDYFLAEVTVILSKDFTIISNFRNFNSLEEYMASYWNDLELHIFTSTLLIFGVVAGFTFIFFGSVVFIYTKSKAIKEKKASSATASQVTTPDQGAVNSGANTI